MKPQVILLGAPGSGKGTQAALMVRELGYLHVSTGDLLRQEILKKTELGEKIAKVIEQGQLVDDALVSELLKKNCDTASGAYIFDGFPRNTEQARILDRELIRGSHTAAIYLEANLDDLISRITNRRTCGNKDCGEIYNLINKPSSRSGICDKCSSELVLRKDDNLETVNNRFNVFRSTISDLLSYYKAKNILHVIDAKINPEVTFVAVRKALGV